MANELFLDTSYAIALSSVNDRLHQAALTLADRVGTGMVRLLTTRAVLLEIGNALSKQRYRAAAIRLLHALESDPNVEILPLTEQLYTRAMQLFRERPDKDWGLTDCISFIVMRDYHIEEALTADEHFQQAGFIALMFQA
jgi:uncharacterized protein